MSEQDLVNEEADSDDEDDDYCPVKNEHEQSNSSGESENEDGDEDDVGVSSTNNTEDKKVVKDLNVTPYDESKTDELWKNFASSTKSSSLSTKTDSPKTTIEIPKPQEQTSKSVTTTKIVEFAGEKISVPVTTSPKPSTENSSLKRPAPSTASASSVLDRLGIGKKQKISTLEKSRLDWDAHKESEALKDDLESHRRGKDSYVERKAFLQRSELREHDHYLTHVKKK